MPFIRSNLTNDNIAIVRKHQSLLQPYYTDENCVVDFDKIRNEPLLVRNFVFTGLVVLLKEYVHTYRRLRHKDTKMDYLDEETVRRVYPEQQWVHYVIGEGFSFLLRSKVRIVLKENYDSFFEECVVDKDNCVEKHMDKVAAFLGLDVQSEDYYLDSFAMFPRDGPKPNVWGASLWMVRMFYIYYSKYFRSIGLLRQVGRFLTDMRYLLPCKFCTINAVSDPVKEKLMSNIDYLINSGDEGMIQHAMALEIALHSRVNLVAVQSKSDAPVSAAERRASEKSVVYYLPLYMDMFGALTLTPC